MGRDRMTLSVRICAVLAALALNACGFLPAAGPTAGEIEERRDPSWSVHIVKATPLVVRALEAKRETGFPESFRLVGYRPNIALRPGDVVGVSIYELGGPSLFAPPPAPGQSAPATTSLPPQVIEHDGQILVPFVGRVAVAGRTPTQAASEIAQRLASQAVQPQVIISLASNAASAVTVGGEANRAGLIPLTLRGERLLDVIAQAGGARFAASEIDVRVIRGGQVATLPLQQIISTPADNIVVQPNDNIVLIRNPKSFIVMGATPKVSQYTFESERVTVAEAIARAGGAIDSVGTLSRIYLFRSEPTSLARDVYAADPAAFDRADFSDQQTRILYRFDLSQATGFFLAQSMQVRDKDIILVANAEATQLQKFLLLLRGLTGPVYDLQRNNR